MHGPNTPRCVAARIASRRKSRSPSTARSHEAPVPSTKFTMGCVSFVAASSASCRRARRRESVSPRMAEKRREITSRMRWEGSCACCCVVGVGSGDASQRAEAARARPARPDKAVVAVVAVAAAVAEVVVAVLARGPGGRGGDCSGVPETRK